MQTQSSLGKRAAPDGITVPFSFHRDPGHGWLAVPAAVAEGLGLPAAIFSRFSYVAADGLTLYLEEDCDKQLFLKAWKRKRGGEPKIETVDHDEDCFVRSQDRIGDDRVLFLVEGNLPAAMTPEALLADLRDSDIHDAVETFLNDLGDDHWTGDIGFRRVTIVKAAAAHRVLAEAGRR